MIVFRGSKRELRDKAMQLAAILSGKQTDTTGIGRAFLLAIGYAALSDIREAFVVKARGGTDAMGIKWEPLKPETIANRRVSKADRQDPQAGQYVRAREAALKAIQREFAKQEGELFDRFLLSMDAPAARKRARQMAAQRASEITGMTKVQALGSRDVEILRDTGVLLNSLTPGVLTHGSYSGPTGEGGEDQIFDIGPGQVTVGTKCVYAEAHQDGNPKRGLPRRQFLPDDQAQVPTEWWTNWIDAGQQALVAAAEQYFSEGPS